MAEGLKTLKGFKDILGNEFLSHRRIEKVSRKYLDLFQYEEIEIPILEKTELFVRSIGEGTDIVDKEMFTFVDKGGDSVSLRPEATAGIVRAYLEHKIYEKQKIAKFFTIGPMFRHERPQRGRLREFHQINGEVFGIGEALIDAEIIFMLSLILKDLGIMDYKVEINSVGCTRCREKFKEFFVAYFAEKERFLCEDCKKRLKKNPLRILDCKVESCKDFIENAPDLQDFLCPACGEHFESFLDSLSKWDIKFFVNRRLVRGLDYYTRSVFEITSDRLGAQNAFVAGGRYDNLVASLGGPSIPGVGFAIGIERLSLLLSPLHLKRGKTFFFAPLGEKAKEFAYRLSKAFAENELRLIYPYGQKSLKSQMRYANSLNADFVLILGDEEINKQRIIFRNMHDGKQIEIPLDISIILDFALRLKGSDFFDFPYIDDLNKDKK